MTMRGAWDEYVGQLYELFSRDFKLHTCIHQGLPIRFDSRILPDGEGKGEGFWHVISRADPKSEGRLVDPRRAERLPWARPLMESEPRSEIILFDHAPGPKDKGVRRYIWLHAHDYLIILQRKPRAFIWVTAYVVDSEQMRRSLRRKSALMSP